jgi:hypothetical protein
MTDFDGLINERTAAFAGREWVFRSIDEWLEDPAAERVFLLTGGPGTGKTAIAARLVQVSRGEMNMGGLRRLGPGVRHRDAYGALPHRSLDDLREASGVGVGVVARHQVADRLPGDQLVDVHVNVAQ